MSADIKQQFWKALAHSPFVMIGLTAAGEHSAPMTAQLDKDADGSIWFFTTRDNRLAAGGPAMMQFASKGHELFACVSGTVTEESSRAQLDKLWSNQAAAWFDGGKDDPRLVMLRFDLDDGELWASELGVVGMFKMMAGLKIAPEEAGKHAEIDLSHG